MVEALGCLFCLVLPTTILAGTLGSKSIERGLRRQKMKNISKATGNYSRRKSRKW